MATEIYLGMPPAIVVKWIKANYKPVVDMTKVPLTFTAEEAGAKLSLVSDNSPTITLETSTTGEEGSWKPYKVGTEITLANVGDKIMFRNSSDQIQNISVFDSYNYFKINSGKIAASGNIMFLMDKTGELKDLSGRVECYAYMFQNCTSLIKAPALPATTLTDVCYNNMFRNCTSLIKAPALPATTLASSCYYEMFKNCTSLNNAPELPTTTLARYCYIRMFDGCTNIPEPKYKMPNLTFDEVVNEIQNNHIFGNGGQYEVQCSDKILVATFDASKWEWTITEK